MSRSLREIFVNYGLVVILGIIWGLAFVAIRRAVVELAPVNLTLVRWIIASVAFLILSPKIAKPKVAFKRKNLPRLLLVAIASVGGYHLSLNYGETIISSGLAGLLISFGPIFVVLLSAIFLKERIRRELVLALVVATIGAFVLSADNNLDFVEVSGSLTVVLAALMYSLYAVGSKPLVTEYGALPTAVWAGVGGTVLILPLLSGGFFVQVENLSLAGWLSVFYLSILSTVVANIILYTLISGRRVSTLSVQLYLVPIVSLVGGILILGESITIFTLVGTGLLFAAIALATRK